MQEKEKFWWRPQPSVAGKQCISHASQCSVFTSSFGISRGGENVTKTKQIFELAWKSSDNLRAKNPAKSLSPRKPFIAIPLSSSPQHQTSLTTVYKANSWFGFRMGFLCTTKCAPETWLDELPKFSSSLKELRFQCLDGFVWKHMWKPTPCDIALGLWKEFACYSQFPGVQGPRF